MSTCAGSRVLAMVLEERRKQLGGERRTLGFSTAAYPKLPATINITQF